MLALVDILWISWNTRDVRLRNTRGEFRSKHTLTRLVRLAGSARSVAMLRSLNVRTVLRMARTVATLRLSCARSVLKRMFPLGMCRFETAIPEDLNANEILDTLTRLNLELKSWRGN